MIRKSIMLPMHCDQSIECDLVLKFGGCQGSGIRTMRDM